VRKYYILTESGTRSAREKVQEFLDFVTIMGQILNPKPSLNLG
jgi:DNA-binding PadR family transcriptional regulator